MQFDKNVSEKRCRFVWKEKLIVRSGGEVTWWNHNLVNRAEKRFAQGFCLVALLFIQNLNHLQHHHCQRIPCSKLKKAISGMSKKEKCEWKHQCTKIRNGLFYHLWFGIFMCSWKNVGFSDCDNCIMVLNLIWNKCKFNLKVDHAS